MDATEQIVRLRLSQREKQKLAKYVERHPEVLKRVDKATQDYKDNVVDSFAKCLNAEPKELGEIKEALSRIFGFYLGQLSDSFSYEKMLEHRDQIYMKTARAQRKEIEEMYQELKKDEKIASTMNLGLFEPMMDQGLGRSDVGDILIARLTELAKQKGVDKALQDSSIHATIRELFPTEQLYKEHVESYRKRAKEAITQTNQGLHLAGLVMPKDGKDRTSLLAVNTFFEYMIKGLESIVDVWMEVNEQIRKEDMAKIYARPKKK